MAGNVLGEPLVEFADKLGISDQAVSERMRQGTADTSFVMDTGRIFNTKVIPANRIRFVERRRQEDEDTAYASSTDF